MFDRFAAADSYLFSVPMWNAGVPYVHKQWIDIISQPGWLFSFTPEAGYSGLIRALSTAAIGAGMLLGGIATRPLTGKLNDRTLIAVGAALLAVGYTVTTAQDLPTLLASATLVGIGQSALHATLQRWATQAAPDARGTSTALFATGTFAGAGAAALLGAILPSQFTAMFITAAACAAISGLIAARHRRNTDDTTTRHRSAGPTQTLDLRADDSTPRTRPEHRPDPGGPRGRAGRQADRCAPARLAGRRGAARGLR